MFDDLSSFARSVGQGLGSLKRDLDHRMGRTDRPQIVPYRGYGNSTQAHINGRVLRDPGLSRAHAGEAWWRNLLNTYKRLESNEIPGARVRIRAFGQSAEVNADQEGYFHAVLPIRSATSEFWQDVEFELLAPLLKDEPPARSRGQVLIADRSAECGVISDL